MIRIATFNLHHCEGRDGRIEVERTARFIRSLNTDLIALQELDRGVPRSGHVDQPKRLEELTGMTVRFFATLPYEGGEFGQAIAAKGGFEARLEMLPRLGSERPRGAIVARWREISLVAAHLSRDRRARAMQTRMLARLASSLEPPVVVLGDLNQPRASLTPLRRAGLSLASSYPVRWRYLAVDHILTGRELRAIGRRVLRTQVSDHPAIVVDLAVS